jgi:glycine/D-amino acid oxidase-like deaminating enzyme
VHTAFSWDAATLNPAQLTLSVHTENLSLGGYDLFAWAPVHRVSEAEGDRKKWVVETKRGKIQTDKVVYATNAYSQALIPELKDLIVPMRGACGQIHACGPL